MSVDLDRLFHIESELEEALEHRARLLAGYAAGVRAAPNLERLASRWPALLDPEVAQQVGEAAGEGTAEPSVEERRARRLGGGLTAWRAWCSGAAAESRGLRALDDAGVAVELEVISFRDAEHELRTAVDRVRRRELARGVEAAWTVAEPHFTEAAARRLETRALNPSSLPGVELDWAQLDRWAERILALTRDAAFDLLDFLFRRERLGGRSSGGGWADLQLVLELGSLREHVPPSQLWAIAASLAAGMGLDPLAEGAIALDIEDRPGRETGACAVAFRVPQELALLQRPARTPADLHRLFGALGQAQQLANLEARVPLTDRALGDPAPGIAAGAFLQAILFEPAWHRKVLRLPSRLSMEMGRAFATRSLVELRVACAAYLAARQISARGISSATREDYRERMSQATGCDGPPMEWLSGDPQSWAARIRGSAACGGMVRHLTEELNEDYWRNPRAGSELREIWKQSGAGPVAGPGSEGEEKGKVEKEAARLVELAAR